MTSPPKPARRSRPASSPRSSRRSPAPGSLALAAALALAACARAPSPAASSARPASPPVGAPVAAPLPDDTLPTIGAPVDRPRAVVLELSCGRPREAIFQASLYADRVANGAGAMFSAAAIQASLLGVVAIGTHGELRGVDLGRPVHLVVAYDEPTAAEQAVLVFGVADEDALRASLAYTPSVAVVVHAGNAAIGTPAALRRVAPYALTRLALADARPDVTGAIFGRGPDDKLAESVGVVLAALAVQAAGASSEPAVSRIARGLGELARVDGSLAIGRDAIELYAVLTPRAGSGFERFVAAQRPSDFAAAAALRPGPWQLVAAGAIEWGALADDLAAIEVDSLFPAALWRTLAPRGWLATGARDLARDGLRVMASGATPAAIASLDAWAKATQAAPLVAGDRTTTARAGAVRARGGRFHQVRGGAPGAPAAREGFVGPIAGGAGASGVLRGEGPPGEAARWLASSPKGDLGPAIEPALAAAKRAGESAAILLDLIGAARPDPAQAALALGARASGGALALRVRLPAGQLAALLR